MCGQQHTLSLRDQDVAPIPLRSRLIRLGVIEESASMLASIEQLRRLLLGVIDTREAQGHDTGGLIDELKVLPASYDAMQAFAERLADLPMRGDWPYVEPDELDAIRAECDPARPKGAIAKVDPSAMAERIRTGFLGSVCGCMLGKPVECDPTLAELRDVLEPMGDWPINDYISQRAVSLLRPGAKLETGSCRETIFCAIPDDDINYSVLGMLILERYGRSFTRAHLADQWLRQLPVGWTFGPERTTLLKIGQASLDGGEVDCERWVRVWNPGAELCGAQIRADAYGYACVGNPALAAELAWRDAGLTHRRTGLYATMFTAAAIACAAVVKDRLDMFRIALQFVPQRSRFAEAVRNGLTYVQQASDWLDGYNRIHERYKAFGHCKVFQETATMINTLRFAEDVGDGICKQVMQGNDTDSYGATAGSLLGCYFGPKGLDERWVKPLNNTLHTTLADFHEQDLDKVADRMSRLPACLAS